MSDDGDSTLIIPIYQTARCHIRYFFNLHVVGLRLTSFFPSAVFSWLSVVVGQLSSQVLASNVKDSQTQS